MLTEQTGDRDDETSQKIGITNIEHRNMLPAAVCSNTVSTTLQADSSNNKTLCVAPVHTAQQQLNEGQGLTGRTLRGSNPSRGEFFSTCPGRPLGPPSLLYNGYQVSFPGVKRPGYDLYHAPQSSAEVKGRVELYLYSTLSLHSTLPLPVTG